MTYSKRALALLAKGKATIADTETEHAVQLRIKEALELAGCSVRETTAYRQKGPSGIDKGIPDLLVFHPSLRGAYIGIEVKRPKNWRWSSPEQEAGFQAGEFAVATCELEALQAVLTVLVRLNIDTERIQRTIRGFEPCRI